MTADATRGTTAGAALYPKGDAPQALSGALRATTAVAALAVSARALPGELAALHREAGRVLADLLDLDLVDVLLAAWHTEGAIAETAHASAAHPDHTEQVHLLNQRIAWSRDDSVELFVDGRSLGTLPVTLQAELAIATLDADIRGGRLVALDTGRLTVTVRLSLAGQELKSGSLDLDLPLTLPLGDGIPLVAAVDVPGQPQEPLPTVDRHGVSGR